MHSKKISFRYKVCHNFKNIKALVESIPYRCRLIPCAKFRGKAIRNKKVKGNKRPPFYKHTFIQVLLISIWVSKPVVTSIANKLNN